MEILELEVEKLARVVVDASFGEDMMRPPVETVGEYETGKDQGVAHMGKGRTSYREVGKVKASYGDLEEDTWAGILWVGAGLRRS